MPFLSFVQSLRRPVDGAVTHALRPRRALFLLAAVPVIAAAIGPVQAMSRQQRHETRLARHEAHAAAIQVRHEAHLAAHQARNAASQAKLTAQHTALASHNAVMAAYAFRGTRYVMGGTSRSGFDCSGFVRFILGHADGVALPRTAVEQFYHGASIPMADLQPGDLVFFKNTYKHGISHVGIYAGGGKFIHAANPRRGVQMDDLNSPYYQAHFAGARRVLPAQMRALATWTR